MSLRDSSIVSLLPHHHLPKMGDMRKAPRVSAPDSISSLITRSFVIMSGMPSAWYSTSDAMATSGSWYA
ncbi:hypothetical protein ATCV1_z591R [Acanthocystis turfacea chlorella virus 1]|uniref:Uncharacterized protein z591R n=1 Tax=Chlorovirus heliozoae TaxID=322019 RepID=A7K9K1_9PHYC|nr:hypothetical protein ATCV1_z591R [Acanthocystis turfacea chlorella virus 1]ABT16725.1 hypothetical protein ATCV1_z591R [Acanthocystis turfacea chlorella virus 1]